MKDLMIFRINVVLLGWNYAFFYTNLKLEMPTF